jgi:hypothetical protein
MKKVLEQTQEQFYSFLVENNAYDVWIKNTTDCMEYDSIKEFLVETPMINWVISAFSWYYTPEGLDFWGKLSAKYRVDFLGF